MNRRLLQFLAAENISQAAFADKIHVARASVSHILKGRNKPGYDFFEGVTRNYPSLNLEWLLTGKGKMYRFDESKPSDDLPIFRESPAGTETDLFSAARDSREAHGEGHVRMDSTDIIPEEFSEVPSPEEDADEKPSEPVQRKAVRITVFYDNGTFEEFSR